MTKKGFIALGISLILGLGVTGLVSCHIPSIIQIEKQAKISGLFPIMQGGKYGYIDKNGTFVINPQYYSGTNFLDSLAYVEESSKKGYIDKAGKYVWTYSLSVRSWVR